VTAAEVPIVQAGLLDDLVGAREQRGRNVQTERDFVPQTSFDPYDAQTYPP
jgi:hypothetical protein